jgi:hypothetical protein
MIRYTAGKVGYVNTRYYRAVPRRGKRRSRIGSFIPLVAVVALAGFGYSWVQGVLAGRQDCEPLCGVLPGPGTSDPVSFDAAQGWRVSYDRQRFGSPTSSDTRSILWQYSDQESVGIESTDTREPERACKVAAQDLGGGYTTLYEVPNAVIGNQVGFGRAYEKTVSRPGKPPLRLRYFQVCITAGDVSLRGFASGVRESRPSAIHADPATTRTAFLLDELAAAVEFTDERGRPLAAAGES